MRKGFNGIDESSIARAFGAIALLVALYGVALSATALVEEPATAGAESPKWFERAGTVIERAPQSTIALVQGASFWAPAASEVGASPSRVRKPTPSGTSFWATRDADSPIGGWQLASGLGTPDHRF